MRNQTELQLSLSFKDSHLYFGDLAHNVQSIWQLALVWGFFLLILMMFTVFLMYIIL